MAASDIQSSLIVDAESDRRKTGSTTHPGVAILRKGLRRCQRTNRPKPTGQWPRLLVTRFWIRSRGAPERGCSKSSSRKAAGRRQRGAYWFVGEASGATKKWRQATSAAETVRRP